MKKINIILAIAAMVCVATTTIAQQKFGHIDSAALLELMPEKVQAEKDLEAVAKPLNEELQKMAIEFENKMAAFQEEQESMTKSVRALKAKEIEDMQGRIQQFQENAQTEITAAEAEILGPIVEKARKAIDEVAEAKGYSYVFDSSLGVLLYMKDSDDLMADVKAKLGL